MAKPDYQEFDRALLAQIQSGRNTMARLDDISILGTLADPHRENGRTPAFRVIDRRLQALRKAGKLRWDGKVWVVL
jgi:hypothetical protein